MSLNRTQLVDAMLEVLRSKGRAGWCLADHMSELYAQLARDKGATEQDVAMVDSSDLDLLMTQKEGSATFVRAQARLRDKLASEAQLVLFPLNHDSHWSLLVYYKRFNTWYACDSLWTQDGVTRFHETYVKRVVKRLVHRWALVPAENGRLMFIDDLPRQTGEWECGRFTLGYIGVFLSPTGRRLQHDRESYEAWLRIYLTAVSMATLPLFTEYLKHLTEQARTA